MTDTRLPRSGQEKTADTVDEWLEDAFSAAREDAASTTRLSSDFSARLMADAERLMPVQTSTPRQMKPQASTGGLRPRASTGWWSGLRTRLGQIEWTAGWPAATGLAACALAGLWIGYAPPMSLEGFTSSFVADLGLTTEGTTFTGDDLTLAFELGGG